MRVKSLPLLTFLLDVHPERVVFFLSGDLTPELQHVPFRKLVLARGPLEPPLIDDDVRDMDWLDPETWNESLSSVIPPLRKGIAIFDISLEGLPPVALDYLALNGFTQLVCYSSEQWVTAKLAPPRVSIRGRLMALRHATIQKIRRGFRIAQRLITPMLRKIQVSIRKALLKGFSKNLHELGVRGFTKEIGHCYRANVPTLVLQADHYGNERSRMVLFDEAIALLPHQSHDLVRGQGLGRFSHWEDEIYFSTPDDTDPNTNGRRYRYIDFSGWRMFLRPLIAFSPSYNVKINRFGAVQLGFGMREVLHSHAPELPLVRRASRPKPLLTAYAGSTFEREVKKSISRTEPRGFQHLDTEPKEIQLLIGTLGPGGSERQLVYVAKGLHERGYPVRVLSAFHHSAETRHYLPYLEELGISCDFISVPHPRFDQRWLMNAWGLDDLELMELMPDYLAEEVWNLYTHLMVNRPRVLHCWLDHTNIIGAVAGWLAGVPEIVLSTRNLNPTHFPSFFKDWWRKWYKLMAESPRVSFIANSRAGAESYASWLRISPDRFRIIYNGIDSSFIKHPAASDISACRDSFGLSPETPVVLGVFRLAREKQPLIFVHAINELRKTHPTVRGLIAGVGHFEKRVRDEIRALNLGDNITLLGRRDDVPTLMTMADVVLLTSAQEGLPNVLMEAQALGRPVVATAVGGVPEVVKHRETGFVCTPGDVQELAGRCRELIDFPEQRATMGHAGAQWIAENFSRESMIAKTVDFYGISAEEQLFLTSEGGKTMSNVGEVMKTDELWTSANPFERDIDDAVTFSLNNAVTQLGFLPGGHHYPAGRTVMEIGPGQDLGVLLILMAHGANGIAVDKYLCAWDNKYHPYFYRSLRAAAAVRFPHGDFSIIDELIANNDHKAATLSVLRVGLEEIDFLPDGSIDWSFSNAVFEHFFDIGRAIHQLARITKDGGLGFHQTDFRDHRDFSHPLEYITMPDDQFHHMMMDLECACGNRQRYTEFLPHFEESGFEVTLDASLLAEEAYLADVLARATPRYKNMPSEALRILSGRFHIKRRAVAARQAANSGN